MLFVYRSDSLSFIHWIEFEMILYFLDVMFPFLFLFGFLSR